MLERIVKILYLPKEKCVSQIFTEFCPKTYGGRFLIKLTLEKRKFVLEAFLEPHAIVMVVSMFKSNTA